MRKIKKIWLRLLFWAVNYQTVAEIEYTDIKYVLYIDRDKGKQIYYPNRVSYYMGELHFIYWREEYRFNAIRCKIVFNDGAERRFYRHGETDVNDYW